MLVYRIEHPDTGKGPYNILFDLVLGNALCDAHTDMNIFPSKVIEFPTHKYDPDWYCCFDSVECLHIWFEGFHDRLACAGFKLAIYELPDLCVIHGKCQSIMNMTRAILITREDIINPF